MVYVIRRIDKKKKKHSVLTIGNKIEKGFLFPLGIHEKWDESITLQLSKNKNKCRKS